MNKVYVVVLVVLAYISAGCGFSYKEEQTQKGEPIIRQNNSKEQRSSLDEQVNDAVKQMQGGQYDRALQILDRVLQKDTKHARALSVKGMTVALQGHLEEGLTLGKQAYALDSNLVENFYNLAIIYKLQGDLGNAEQWFLRVIQAEPKHVWSLYGLATIYADRGERERAFTYLKEAIAVDASVKAVAKDQDHFEKYRKDEDFQKIIQ